MCVCMCVCTDVCVSSWGPLCVRGPTLTLKQPTHTHTMCVLTVAPPSPGSMGGVFPEGEESAHEDLSQWSVEDVCGFISSLAGCTEYAQVRGRETPEHTEREREREREGERERERVRGRL